MIMKNFYNFKSDQFIQEATFDNLYFLVYESMENAIDHLRFGEYLSLISNFKKIKSICKLKKIDTKYYKYNDDEVCVLTIGYDGLANIQTQDDLLIEADIVYFDGDMQYSLFHLIDKDVRVMIYNLEEEEE